DTSIPKNYYTLAIASFSFAALCFLPQSLKNTSSTHKYIEGITTSVRNVATDNPKIIATPIGRQNAVFSPPITQLNERQSKSIPVVKGTRPSIVQIAVKNTGLNLITPACTRDSSLAIPRLINS